MKMLMVAALMAVFSGQQDPVVPKGERPVKLYEQSNKNAGATPYADDEMFKVFGGIEGLTALSNELVTLLTADKRVEGIFRASDLVRLKRTLTEQLCYILGGPCDYTGMNMRVAHKDHGITMREYLVLVELAQVAMEKQKIPFGAQNKLLAKLAPMYREIVRR